MAVLSANVLYTGRTATLTFLQRRTYQEVWEVVVSSWLDNEQTIYAAGAVPLRGQSFSRDPLAIATELEFVQSEENPLIWYVTVKYDSEPDFPDSKIDDKDQDPTDVPENPLERPPIWRISFAKANEVVRRWRPVDNAGNLSANFIAIRNSAKLPFDPPAMADYSRPVLRVTKNVPSVTFEYLLVLQDAVNEKKWRGLLPRQARVDGVESGNKFENGVAYVELTIDIMLKRETWDLRLLDQGDAELVQTGTTPTNPPVPIFEWRKSRDALGNFGPFPLDGKGRKLDPKADPVFLRGLPEHYHLQDFNAIMPF